MRTYIHSLHDVRQTYKLNTIVMTIKLECTLHNDTHYIVHTNSCNCLMVLLSIVVVCCFVATVTNVHIYKLESFQTLKYTKDSCDFYGIRSGQINICSKSTRSHVAWGYMTTLALLNSIQDINSPHASWQIHGKNSCQTTHFFQPKTELDLL